VKRIDRRASHATWRLAGYILVFALVVPNIASCGSRNPAGTTFFRDYATSIGAKAIRPGFEIGLLYFDINNTSTSTAVINSVAIPGPGIGTVVRPVQIRLAPLQAGPNDYETNSVAGALYTTNPPVLFEGHACRKQALAPVRGFRMRPGSVARIWIVLRAIRPGKWSISSHVISYTVGKARYRQVEPVRAYGSVADHAAYIPPDSEMAECVGPEGAAFLPGYRASQASH
jgi:hypothetical protein